MKVFLGGTCNNSPWRGIIKPKLEIDYFDPVVKNWTEECIAEELKQREVCDLCLYVLTPEMTGVYSIAEVVDDSNKRPERTIFVLLSDFNGVSFTKHQEKSLQQVGRMVVDNGGVLLTSLDDCISLLNKIGRENE